MRFKKSIYVIDTFDVIDDNRIVGQITYYDGLKSFIFESDDNELWNVEQLEQLVKRLRTLNKIRHGVKKEKRKI